MTMKKSLIAIAVSSAFVAPMAAQADAGAYGRVNVGIANVNDEGVGTYGMDEGLGMMNVSSRFGFAGSEDLGNGLSAIYKYELAVDATQASTQTADRLSYVGLEGDFGQLKLGRVWSAWYDYLGWNTDRSQFWGGTGYYGYGGGFTGTNLNIGPTTRASDTVKYTYGGGGYSSDPFTFTLEANMNPVSAGGNAEGDAFGGGQADPQAFDLITAAAQGTFGMFTVNGAYRTAQSNDTSVNAEPSQIGIGGRVDLGPAFVGVNFTTTDPDANNAPEPSMFEVLGTYDFGNGLSAQLSVSQLDADQNNGANDTTGMFAQVNKALSSRTNVYAEFNTVDIDGGTGGTDVTPQLIMVGIGHSF